MKNFIKIALFVAAASLAVSCNGGKKKAASEDEAAVKDSTETMASTLAFDPAQLPEEPVFDINTNLGTITVKLYSDTPKHRDNFVKLASERFYDGILFHRIIKGFMIQTGDPLTLDRANKAKFGTGGPGYEIPAEIVPGHSHIKGALAAARKGDQANPMKNSSGSQFYIVTGKKYNAQELVAMEKTMQNRQKQAVFDELVAEHKAEIMDLRRARNSAGLQELQEKLIKETEEKVKGNLFHFTPEQKEAYTTVGGTPFLDNSYSVYGEVVEGMDVVEKIEKVATDSNDRPVDDVKILKATVVE